MPFRLAALVFLAAVPLSQDKPAALPPEPDAAAQKEKLKLVKDIFKDEYARKLPADQQALAEKLLQKGLETQDDLTTRYVLLKESRDIAAAAGAVETALQAATELGKSFAVKVLPLKLETLAKAAAASKDVEGARAAARAYLSLVPEAIRADDYDLANAAATKAEPLAKAAQDPILPARAQELQREIASLKSEYQKVKGVLEKPASSDAEAVGRYLCFVRGDWETGLPILAGGAKPPLKTLVEKDVAQPAEADRQVEIAEGWWELAQKEKGPWRRSKIVGRAQHWLEKALETATGLVKTRVEKRMAEIEEVQPGVVNLFRFIDPKHEAMGDWAFEQQALVCSPADPSRLMIPYTPPDEYDVTAVVERQSGADAIIFGLVKGSAQFCVWIDGFSNKGCFSGLDMIDNVTLERIAGSVKGPLLSNGKAATVVISVRKGGVLGTLDGKSFLNWQGNFNRLSTHATYKPTNPKAMFLSSWGNRFVIRKLTLTPIAGQGKRLR